MRLGDSRRQVLLLERRAIRLFPRGDVLRRGPGLHRSAGGHSRWFYFQNPTDPVAWFGRDDVKSIAQYNQEIAKFSDNGQTFDGAYGPHVQGQWPYVEGALKRDVDSRQAVISIFQPRKEADVSKDVPCTLTLQFLIRHGMLHTIACMRSSDVWLGLPYDFFNFSMLANILAGQLGVVVGPVTMHLGSSHLYTRNEPEAEMVLSSPEMLGLVQSPYLGGRPPQELFFKLMDPALSIKAPDPWMNYINALGAGTRATALLALAR